MEEEQRVGVTARPGRGRFTACPEPPPAVGARLQDRIEHVFYSVKGIAEELQRTTASDEFAKPDRARAFHSIVPA